MLIYQHDMIQTAHKTTKALLFYRNCRKKEKEDLKRKRKEGKRQRLIFYQKYLAYHLRKNFVLDVSILDKKISPLDHQDFYFYLMALEFIIYIKLHKKIHKASLALRCYSWSYKEVLFVLRNFKKQSDQGFFFDRTRLFTILQPSMKKNWK